MTITEIKSLLQAMFFLVAALVCKFGLDRFSQTDPNLAGALMVGLVVSVVALLFVFLAVVFQKKRK